MSQDTPFSDMEKSEQVQFVSKFLESLKPDYREIIIPREYQNLSYEEIAAITRTSISAVKSRLFKARKKLAQLMESVVGQYGIEGLELAPSGSTQVTQNREERGVEAASIEVKR